ncbi:MAG: flagellar hook-length control protein FliK, partial [Lachnospiraceae bacterium]|nr:flagellar hook-length control protein FliK [Lachnospiraceae bacterium]
EPKAEPSLGEPVKDTAVPQEQIREFCMALQNSVLVKELRADAENLLKLNPQTPAYKIAQAQFLQKSLLLENEITQTVKNALFGEKGLMDQIRARFTEQLTLRPEDVGNEKQVEQFYEKLINKMQHLQQALSHAGPDASPAVQSAWQMQENVQFMNNLNQVYQYVQLPLKMFDQNTNGELYVYTNKKHLADADGNMSAFLHLTMDHIGPLDVRVQLSDSNRVSTQFYLRDDMIDFIADHIHLLDERLQAKGYHVSTGVHTMQDEEEKSVIDHMMDPQAIGVKSRLLSVNSFDMKA